MESVMSKFCWCAVLLAVLLCTSGTRALAKPPDLPADNDIRCREACEPTETWRWPLGWEMPAVRPHGAALRGGMSGGVNSDLDPEQCEGAQKARELFDAARRCTRAGDLDQARARLREAHMANPTCHYGQRAIQRLLEMEANEMGEESELPVFMPESIRRILNRTRESLEEPQSDDEETSQAERSFQRVRQSTQPLGMVRMPTY
jgi:hypothetical protein